LYQVSMKSAKALPRYGSGHKSAGRTDNAKTLSLRLWRGMILNSYVQKINGAFKW